MSKLKKHVIKSGKDVPRQMIVRNGKLCYSDTNRPVKSLKPFEGEGVNIINSRHLTRLADGAYMLRHWGA